MHNFMVGFWAVCFILIATVNTHATMVRQVWTGTVSSVEGAEAETIWSTGNLFTFSFTYDDSGTTQSLYQDGANGKDNDGNYDDILDGIYDIKLPADNDELASDINYNLDEKTNSLLPSVIDTTSENYQMIYVPPEARGFFLEVLSDGLSVSLSNYGGSVQYSRGFDDDEHGALELQFGSLSTAADVSPVPEPATMLLFGTGLVGLVGARFKNIKK